MNAPATVNAAAAKPLRQVTNVRELLVNDQARSQLAKVAAKHMNPERMMRVVANAMRTTPQLAECDPMSMLGALMTAASLGLEPNTPLGHAYLIPFKNTKKGITEVQFIIGYKGFADLARRSGQIVGLHADVVYSDDELWSYEYGSNMHLRHKPGPRRGQKTHAYCHVTLKDGQAFVVLPFEQVIKTRDSSQGWKTAVRFGKTAMNPWSTHEDRMAAKTAVRALANAGEMPLSIEFLEAVEADETATGFDPTAGSAIHGEVIDAEATDYDQETGEVTETVRQIDQERGPVDPVQSQMRKPEPEKVRTAPKQSQAVEQQAKPVQREEAQPKADPLDIREDDEAEGEPLVHPKWYKLRDAIYNDLNDGAPVDGILGFYEEQLEQMKAQAPKVHAEILAEIEKRSDEVDP